MVFAVALALSGLAVGVGGNLISDRLLTTLPKKWVLVVAVTLIAIGSGLGIWESVRNSEGSAAGSTDDTWLKFVRFNNTLRKSNGLLPLMISDDLNDLAGELIKVTSVTDGREIPQDLSLATGGSSSQVVVYRSNSMTELVDEYTTPDAAQRSTLLGSGFSQIGVATIRKDGSSWLLAVLAGPPADAASNSTSTTTGTTATSTVESPDTGLPGLFPQIQGSIGANSFSDPHTASGIGPKVPPGGLVMVSCKLYDPTILSTQPDGYWYRLEGAPWGGEFYAAANTFMNGDPKAGPYTDNTDFDVPDCK